MASNTNFESSSTGYDVQVIGDHPPQLNCGICALIIKHAMHRCTNHAFCKGCIIKYIECGIRSDGNVKCPGGCNIIIDPSKPIIPNLLLVRVVWLLVLGFSCIGKPIYCSCCIVLCVQHKTNLEPNNFADRMVNTWKTKCSNDSCPWKGDLLDLVQVHQTKCEYAMQLCGNNGCI